MEYGFKEDDGLSIINKSSWIRCKYKMTESCEVI